MISSFAMAFVATLSQGFWFAEIFLRILLWVRLWHLDLTPRYPVFVSYLGFATLRSLALALLMTAGKTAAWGVRWYGNVYVFTVPVLWAFYFLICLELYSRMLDEFPGIRRLGRLVLFSALGAATALCCF